jgi:hypothetical protein
MGEAANITTRNILRTIFLSSLEDPKMAEKTESALPAFYARIIPCPR